MAFEDSEDKNARNRGQENRANDLPQDRDVKAYGGPISPRAANEIASDSHRHLLISQSLGAVISDMD